VKNVCYDVLVGLFQRHLISKTEFLRALKSLKINDEQALQLFDLEVWGEVEVKAHFAI
jgi:hypothetical protein